MNKIEIEIKKQILNITLNRPEVHNALDGEMIRQLTEAFALPLSNLNIRAVVVKGNGKSFSAGADLEYMRSMIQYSLSENVQAAQDLFAMFESGLNCPVPVLVHVQGKVMGGAIGLVAIGDCSVAESDSQFCFSEVRLGLVPAVISPFVLKKMNVSMARELMLTGQLFLADQALSGGLVQFIGTKKDSADYVEKMLNLVTSGGPEAIRETKRLLKSLAECRDLMDVKQLATRIIAERRVSEEGQEGIRAFFEKRSPSWKS